MQYQGASSAREALHAFLQVPKIERAQSLGVRIRRLAPAHTRPARASPQCRRAFLPVPMRYSVACAVVGCALSPTRTMRLRCRTFRPFCVLAV